MEQISIQPTMRLLLKWMIVFLPIGVIVAGSSVVPNLLFYKCPHCGKHLGSNGGDFCQYCGKSIDN